jgi:hypothetical protein
MLSFNCVSPNLLILDLIETGKITVPEALELLDVKQEDSGETEELLENQCEDAITIQLYLN